MIVLRRFNLDTLEKFEVSINDLERVQYFAISHVWGDVQKRTVYGEEILASEEKVKFITGRLREIVGTQVGQGALYFWMDILCIDQENKEARVAVTQHIPTIFRCAQRTLLLRDGMGLASCCADAMGELDEHVGQEKPLLDHFMDDHAGVNFKEGALTRLWLLQEVLLSDTIQFERCDTLGEIQVRRVEDPPRDQFERYIACTWTAELLVREIPALALTWASHAIDDLTIDLGPAVHDFIRAFLRLETVSRSHRVQLQIPRVFDLHQFNSSVRQTGTARDFILATMPQFRFYSQPQNAKDKSFGELFVDCYRQLQQAQVDGLRPLLGQIRQGISEATDNIPTPKYLGDMVKLLTGPKLTGTPISVEVSVVTGEPEEWFSVLLPQVLRCARFSEARWKLAMLGEFQNIANEKNDIYGSDDDLFTEGYQLPPGERHTLLEMYTSWRIMFMFLKMIQSDATDEQIQKEFVNAPAFSLVLMYSSFKFMVRLMTLVSCGMGISALEWVEENMTLLVVKVSAGPFMLGLAPKGTEGYNFYLVESQTPENSRSSRNLTLIAKHPQTEVITLCLFPQL